MMDFRSSAKARLPKLIYDYLEGGSEDEWSCSNNIRAFDRYELMPQYLRDISHIDTTTTVLGTKISMPLILSPTGLNRMFHHEKEFAVSRAAARAGTMYSLSTLSSASIEDIARVCDGPKMFQIYIHKDRGLTREFLRRAQDSGYDAICLTVDATVTANRERDERNGLGIRPRWTLRGLLSYATHPSWSLDCLRDRDFSFANLAKKMECKEMGLNDVAAYVSEQFDRSLTWKDTEMLAREWNGAFAIKGLQAAQDAVRARDAGATAVIISNHGGRQLDYAAAPIDCVTHMRDAVSKDLELIVDGGVRRGTHVLKALALGANACSFGRPYLYALAAGGQSYVERALDLMQPEIERAMGMTGIRRVSEIGSEHIVSY